MHLQLLFSIVFLDIFLLVKSAPQKPIFKEVCKNGCPIIAGVPRAKSLPDTSWQDPVSIPDSELVPDFEADIDIEVYVEPVSKAKAETSFDSESLDIVEIAVASPELSTLVTALTAADLVEALTAEGPFTVFAPNNDAFAKVRKLNKSN